MIRSKIDWGMSSAPGSFVRDFETKHVSYCWFCKCGGIRQMEIADSILEDFTEMLLNDAKAQAVKERGGDLLGALFEAHLVAWKVPDLELKAMRSLLHDNTPACETCGSTDLRHYVRDGTYSLAAQQPMKETPNGNV